MHTMAVRQNTNHNELGGRWDEEKRWEREMWIMWFEVRLFGNGGWEFILGVRRGRIGYSSE